MQLDRFLFKHIDNSSLIVFRIIFGFLCFAEAVGAIFTGWLRRTLMEPDFTFSFIGFEWLQPLPGNGMYIYYIVMGISGLLIMVGYRYRLSIIVFTLLWTGTYLMQKSSYNNHYYLLVLLSTIMIFLPANQYASLDAKRNPEIKAISMPNWCKNVFILQMLIVYSYGCIAKLYPDWWDLSVMEILMRGKSHYFLVGDLLQEKWVHYFLAYGGILFDGLIIPLFLYKPTRKFALAASVFFHLFNSFVFQIGIFPYLSLAFALFFFEPQIIHKLFLKRKPFYEENEIIIPNYKKPLIALFSIYFVIQILLPLRHYVIADSVLWTEEGHRLSWRMMLRSKSGRIIYHVTDKKTNETTIVNLSDYLSKKQQRTAASKPDVIWQFAQILKKDYASKGQDISVHVDSKISVNGRPYAPLIDPKVDLAATKWLVFKHNPWILPSKLD